MLLLPHFLPISRKALAGWWNNKAPRLGAALAYYTILSLAPLLILATPVATQLFGPERARGGIIDQFQQLVGEKGALAIESMVNADPFTVPTRLTTILSALVLLFAASGVFAELQDALNTVWGVAPLPGRAALWSYVKQRILSFAMVMAICFLLLVSLVISAGLAIARNYIDARLNLIAQTWTFAHSAISILVITLLFALIYKVLPDAKIPWRDVWVGSLITSLLFTLGKFLIGLYLGQATFGKAYGGAGSLVVLLVWIYYSSQIFMLGAEFTHAYSVVRGSRVKPVEHAAPITKEARAQQGIPTPKQVEQAAHKSGQTLPKDKAEH